MREPNILIDVHFMSLQHQQSFNTKKLLVFTLLMLKHYYWRNKTMWRHNWSGRPHEQLKLHPGGQSLGRCNLFFRLFSFFMFSFFYVSCNLEYVSKRKVKHIGNTQWVFCRLDNECLKSFFFLLKKSNL